MVDTPKLTDDEAKVLRVMDMTLGQWNGALDSLLSSGLRNMRGTTSLGHAALARYDAEQRRQIVVKAMQKCVGVADRIANKAWKSLKGSNDPSLFGDGAGAVGKAIRILIAKEEA